MKHFIHAVFLATLVWSMQLSATEVLSDVKSAQILIEDIKAGGHILYMRHGITKRKDKSRSKVLVDLSSCGTQRNLTEEGQAQVKRIGGVIKSLGIPIGKVKSSPYCRTKETAKAVFGAYDVDDKLAYSMSKAQKESEMLGKYLKNAMFNSSDVIANAVFVGHTANLKDGLGIWPKPEGVIVIFKKEGSNLVFKGTIKPNEWPTL